MTAQEIRGLAAAIHEAAVAKGFWDVENARDKHVAKWRGELGEVIQEHRCNRPMLYVDDIEVLERITDPAMFDGRKPEGVAAELADFVMMALDLFAVMELDDDEYGIIARALDIQDDEEHRNDKLPLEVLVNSLYAAAENVIYVHNDEIRYGHVQCVCWPQTWLKARGYDLWELIRMKMAYNASRPKLHERAY